MIPMNTPAPIPTTMLSKNGMTCSSKSDGTSSGTACISFKNMNGSMIVSGVLNMLSSISNDAVLDL